MGVWSKTLTDALLCALASLNGLSLKWTLSLFLAFPLFVALHSSSFSVLLSFLRIAFFCTLFSFFFFFAHFIFNVHIAPTPLLINRSFFCLATIYKFDGLRAKIFVDDLPKVKNLRSYHKEVL